MNSHYHELEKQAFLGAAWAATRAAATPALETAGKWLGSRFGAQAARTAAQAATKAAPAATQAATAAAPAVEAAAPAAKGFMDKALHVLNAGPGDIASWIGKRTGHEGLQRFGTWATTGLGERAGIARNWTPQGIAQVATLPGAVLGVPGFGALSAATMPVFAAADTVGTMGGNAISAARMQNPANQQAFTNDINAGKNQAAYTLMGQAMEDPRMFDPNYLNQQLGPDMQKQIDAARSGNAGQGGMWDNMKRFAGLSHDGPDFTTSLALQHAYPQVSNALSKQAGIATTAVKWGGKVFKPLMLGLPALPIATAALSSKPYDAEQAAQLGVAGGAAGFQDAIKNLNPVERFMTQHVDPTLAVAAADKAHPGFARGYGNWYQQQTGKPFSYGALGSVYSNWNAPANAPAPGKFYVNSNLNMPAYLA